MDTTMILCLILFAVALTAFVVNALRGYILKKTMKNTNGNTTINVDELNYEDERVANYVSTYYYRYQKDVQGGMLRTPEQQKIVDEYFIIQKYKTSNVALSYASIAAIFFGILMLIIGILSAKTALIVIGVICVLAFLVLRYLYKKSVKMAPRKVMTDEEYEKLVAEKRASLNVRKMSLEKLGLDESQVAEVEPIVLQDKVFTDTSLGVYNNSDFSLHSSTHYVTTIYFTDEQIFVYKVQFDMCCNLQEEWASEFFYDDICDVSSYVKKNTLTFGGVKVENNTLDFTLIATNSEIGFTMAGENARLASIQGMKQKIREKKNH